jgi:DNA repair protein RecO (recombination protein O)
MPMVRTLAIVLHSTDVTESSKVLSLFCREVGQVSAMAKGARRLKSPFQSSLDLLSVCDIVVLRKSSEVLSLLTEATLVERFDAARRDLWGLSAGYYVAELLSELAHPDDPHPKLFDAARVTLRNLADPDLRQLRLIRFELACLRELGHAPSLEACVHCGLVVEGSGDGSMAFGVALGGVLCPTCRAGQVQTTWISRGGLDALRRLAAPGDAWRSIDWSRASLGEVRATTGGMLAHIFGRRPRMLSALQAWSSPSA